MPSCVKCRASLRDGAAFCGECGERQPAAAESAEAVARYREVLARFLSDGGGMDDDKRGQLDALRVRLGVSPASHARLLAELEPAAPRAPTVRLSIDVSTLAHFEVGTRCLVRLRVENDGPVALEGLTVRATLSGRALEESSHGTVFPGRAAVVPLWVVPDAAGFHELAGVLRAVDLLGEASAYRFDTVHFRVGDKGGPTVVHQTVNIDQSQARVVDNSGAAFAPAGPAAGGLVSEGDWHPLPLRAEAPAKQPVQGTTVTSPGGERPVDFAVTTDKATWQVTSQLAQGDLATVYGGHPRGGGPSDRVAVKLADQASDNDLLQHEVRVLGILRQEQDKPAAHLPTVRDQFRTADGRLGTVFDRLDGYDLTQVVARLAARGERGLDPRHLVWVLRRALSVLGWAHKHGVLHGNVDPSHLLVRPRDHMVWLVDWCWAVVNPAQTGQGFKALNEVYGPPEVRDRRPPTPASDLYSLGKCVMYLAGGSPADKTLPDAVDPRLARVLKFMTVESQGGRAQDAWELYFQVEKVREQIWGPHEFVPLEL